MSTKRGPIAASEANALVNQDEQGDPDLDLLGWWTQSWERFSLCVVVVWATIWPSPHLCHGADKSGALFAAAPSLLDKGRHEVQPIQQRATGPKLAVSRPALVNPICARSHLSECIKPEARCSCSLSLQYAGLQWGRHAEADGNKRSALVVSLSEKIELGFASIGRGRRGNDNDIEGWACFKGVLCQLPFILASRCRRRGRLCYIQLATRLCHSCHSQVSLARLRRPSGILSWSRTASNRRGRPTMAVGWRSDRWSDGFGPRVPHRLFRLYWMFEVLSEPRSY